MKTVATALTIAASMAVLALSACTTDGTGDGAVSSSASLSSSAVSSLGISVSQPLPHTAVTSPLAIAGVAPGTWFFEASFPIQLLDASGSIIGQTTAKAQGDWMTTGLVPFTATIVFDQPPEQTGTVVFSRDNPSGLPENAASFRVPVQF